MQVCLGCGSLLEDAGPAGLYCPNRDCNHEEMMGRQMIRQFNIARLKRKLDQLEQEKI